MEEQSPQSWQSQGSKLPSNGPFNPSTAYCICLLGKEALSLDRAHRIVQQPQFRQPLASNLPYLRTSCRSPGTILIGTPCLINLQKVRPRKNATVSTMRGSRNAIKLRFSVSCRRNSASLIHHGVTDDTERYE